MKVKSLLVGAFALVLSSLAAAPAMATGGSVTGSLTLPTGVTFDASASQTAWLTNNPDQGLVELALPGVDTTKQYRWSITVNSVAYSSSDPDGNTWFADCSVPNDATTCLYIDTTPQGDLTGASVTVAGSLDYASTFDFSDVIADFAAIGLTVVQSEIVNAAQYDDGADETTFYVTLANSTSEEIMFAVDEFKVDGVATTITNTSTRVIPAGTSDSWERLGTLQGNAYWGYSNAPLALTITEFVAPTVSVGSLVLPAGVTVSAHQPLWWEYNSQDNKTCVNLKFTNTSSTAYTLATKLLTVTAGNSTTAGTDVNYIYLPARGAGYFWQSQCSSGDLRNNATITLGGSMARVTGPKLVNKIKMPSGYVASLTVNDIYYDRISRKSYLNIVISGPRNVSNVALRFSNLKFNGKKLTGERISGASDMEGSGYRFYLGFDPIAGDQRLGKTFTLEGKVAKEVKTRTVDSLVTTGLVSDTWVYTYPAETFSYDAKKDLTSITMSLGNSSSSRVRFDLSRLVVKTQIKKKGKWQPVKTYPSLVRTSTIASNNGGEVVVAKIPGDLRSNWKSVVYDGIVTSTVVP